MLLAPLLGGRSAGVGELADAAGVAGPTATRMLHQLQARGLVVRGPDAADSRRVLASLTPEGEATVQRRGEAVEAGYRRVIETLGEQERGDLERLLLRFADVLEADTAPSRR